MIHDFVQGCRTSCLRDDVERHLLPLRSESADQCRFCLHVVKILSILISTRLEVFRTDRQLSDPLACRGEDRVAQRRRDRRKTGFADAAPPVTAATGRWAGQAAVDRLGARLPAVAQLHGMTAADLRTELLRDRSLFVDATDRLLFVDPPQPATVGQDAVYDPSIPEGEVFTLQSKPGASRVVFLDFDGHTISGTAWPLCCE